MSEEESGSNVAAEVEPQVKLIPDERPDVADVYLNLDELPPNEELIGEPPRKELIDQIRDWGLISPVSVIRRANGTLKVHHGKRRIKSMRLLAAEWEGLAHSDEGVPEGENPFAQVPARMVTDSGTYSYEVLTWVLQEQSDNHPAELETLEALFQAGATPEEIAAGLHVDTKKIKAKLKLMDLTPPLKQAVKDGRMKASPAERAARLPRPAQERLEKILEEKGRVTGQDVAAQALARIQAAATSSELEGLGDLPDIEEMEAAEDDVAEMDEEETEDVIDAAATHLQERALGARMQRKMWTEKDIEAVMVLVTAVRG